MPGHHNTDEIGLGVIGCGGFGLFAMQHFLQVPGVRLAGIAGTHRQAAIAAARRFGVENVDPVERLLERSDVELVYIATPPFLHHPQALAALEAGKHVICEKPLCLTLEQADELLRVARHRDRLIVANLMQRYNPLYDAVGQLIRRKPLGDLLRVYFENYAADEGLPPQHWFWDRSKSGGIFIEHGVHFFDLLAGWLGPGHVVGAQEAIRPGTGFVEQVQCAARYGDVLVNFYHGFHQPGRLDRQEMRLVFERGDVTLYEWIPSRVRIHAIADEADTRTLCELFPGARLDVTAVYAGKERACMGRHKPLDVYQMIELHWGEGQQKMHRYGELLRAFLADQLAWIRDRTHQRRITEQNGRQSLRMAIQADRMARAAAGIPPANEQRVAIAEENPPPR